MIIANFQSFYPLSLFGYLFNILSIYAHTRAVPSFSDTRILCIPSVTTGEFEHCLFHFAASVVQYPLNLDVLIPLLNGNLQ